MTLAELVTICIKDVVKDGNDAFIAASLIAGDFNNDPQYSDLVNNAIPSINKAIARLVVQKKLPFKTTNVAVVYDAATDIKKIWKQYTVTIPNDFYTVVSIIYVDTDGRLESVPWQAITKTTYYLPLKKDGSFIIQYAPTIPYLTAAQYSTNLDTTYNITDLMAQYITYFTRADLWETEQPQLAQTYRQYAEEYFDQIENPVMSFRQEQVHTKYHGDM